MILPIPPDQTALALDVLGAAVGTLALAGALYLWALEPLVELDDRRIMGLAAVGTALILMNLEPFLPVQSSTIARLAAYLLAIILIVALLADIDADLRDIPPPWTACRRSWREARRKNNNNH